MDRQAGRSTKQVQIPGILKPNARLLQHIGQFTAFFNISGKKSHQEVYNLIIETEKELRGESPANKDVDRFRTMMLGSDTEEKLAR